MQKKTVAENIWGMIFPILVYDIVSSILPVVWANLVPALQQETNAMWLLTLVNFCMLPLMGWMYRSDRVWRQRTEENGKAVRAGDILWVLLGTVFISRGMNLLIGLTPLPYYFPEYEAVSETIYSCSLISQIAASVISAPILEELLMRGIFYNRTKHVTPNLKLAMLVNALIFGIFHGNVVQGVYAVLMGLLFVFVYEKYQSLPMVILAHMAANATSILLEVLPGINEIMQEPGIYYLQTIICLLAGMVCWKKLK